MRMLKVLATILTLGTMTAEVKADAVVTGDVNLRSAPSTQGARLGVLPRGTQVALLGCMQGWCEVASGAARGWASARYLHAVPAAVFVAPNGGLLPVHRLMVVPSGNWGVPTWTQPAWPQPAWTQQTYVQPGWAAPGYRLVNPGWTNGWYVTR